MHVNCETEMSGIDVALYRSAVIAATLAALSVASWLASRRPMAGYEPGDRFEELPQLPFDAAPITLIVWFDHRCRACIDSLDLYARVVAARRRARVVFVTRGSEADLRAYLNEHGISPDIVASLASGATKVERYAHPTSGGFRPGRARGVVWTLGQED